MIDDILEKCTVIHGRKSEAGEKSRKWNDDDSSFIINKLCIYQIVDMIRYIIYDISNISISS